MALFKSKHTEHMHEKTRSVSRRLSRRAELKIRSVRKQVGFGVQQWVTSKPGFRSGRGEDSRYEPPPPHSPLITHKHIQTHTYGNSSKPGMSAKTSKSN